MERMQKWDLTYGVEAHSWYILYCPRREICCGHCPFRSFTRQQKKTIHSKKRKHKQILHTLYMALHITYSMEHIKITV